MPFNDSLPPQGTNPWYTPLVVNFIGGLRTFVNSLETAITSGLQGKANATHTHAAADVTSGTLDVARIPALSISKTIDLQTALDAKLDGLNGATGLWIGTQAQYDAIGTKSPTIYYVVTG